MILSSRQTALIAITVLVALGLAFWLAASSLRRAPLVEEPRSAGDAAAVSQALSQAAEFVEPLEPVAATRFQNTGPEATYVGAAACTECHQDEYDSYLRTAHSRSLADVDLTMEPPAGKFSHAETNRSYQVYHRGNQMRHREVVQLPDGETVELADFPVRYVIGSGEHARSYLVETDGFLVESPITWYASRADWALSPGYEVFQAGFARPVVFDCLFCHAGRIRPIDGNANRVAIDALAIDCERCHGPGSLHVAHHASGEASAGVPDLTIVNPAHLTREDNEAICAQCHFHSDAEVDVRGRSIRDFGPGHALADFRVHFALQADDKAMVVTGHGEQMHLSRCYQQSESLTCTTCHDPHDKPTARDRLGYYRDKCLACHTEEACGVVEAERRLTSPQDDCVSCHMPTGSTEIRHIAATHHRIGVHDAVTAPSLAKPTGTLVPIDDLSHLPQIEQDRCLGVAYVKLAVQTSDPSSSEMYRRRAVEILERVREQGLRDSETEVALAKAYQFTRPDASVALARQALRLQGASADLQVDALFVMSNALMRMQQTDQAIEALEQLVRMRRRGEDWFLLGVCRYQAGDLQGALEAVRQAVEIRPDLPNFHGLLAELYQRLGSNELAQEHRQRAAQFSQFQSGRSR